MAVCFFINSELRWKEFIKKYDNVDIVVEPEKLGTGGAIKHAIKTLNLSITNSLTVLSKFFLFLGFMV